MALTGKQVRQLRALAHHLNPVVNVGRGDINDGRRRADGRVPLSTRAYQMQCPTAAILSAREAASELAERCGADVVQVIGHRFSLYRVSSRKDVDHIKFD